MACCSGLLSRGALGLCFWASGFATSVFTLSVRVWRWRFWLEFMPTAFWDFACPASMKQRALGAHTARTITITTEFSHMANSTGEQQPLMKGPKQLPILFWSFLIITKTLKALILAAGGSLGSPGQVPQQIGLSCHPAASRRCAREAPHSFCRPALRK